VNLEQQAVESDRLLSFCQKVTQQREHWPPDEDFLATQFVAFFGLSAVTNFEKLSGLCVELGITVTVRRMPAELRGHNAAYNGTRKITVAEDERFPGAKEHTLLHELRELLEHTFVDLSCAVAANGDALEQRAEHFACLVRSNLVREMMVVWLQQSALVEKKWQRYGAYILSVLGGLGMFLGCVLLPMFEDQALEFRRQRSLATQRNQS